MKKALRIFAALSIGITSYVICGLLPFGEWVDILVTADKKDELPLNQLLIIALRTHQFTSNFFKLFLWNNRVFKKTSTVSNFFWIR